MYASKNAPNNIPMCLADLCLPLDYITYVFQLSHLFYPFYQVRISFVQTSIPIVIVVKTEDKLVYILLFLHGIPGLKNMSEK
jgi:hypothetical protein